MEYRLTRRPILTATLVVWAGWLLLMFSGNLWHHFKTVWFMSVTMAFGSFIAGATSEGGGAVAFPVMTLIFGIKPYIARDFALMIQTIGMMSAAFTIFCLKIPVEWRAVLYGSIGGVAGIILGIEIISPLLPPAYTKVFFTSTWLSFALALYWMNRQRDREVYDSIVNFENKHAVLLFLVGIIGGIVSGLTGSGLDILTFSLLVLCFRLDEKIATPTSVVMMGMNAFAGFIWKGALSSGMAPEAWQYWYVCIPICVVGAPLGAWFIKNKNRLFIAGFLYLSIAVQFVAAIIIIPMSTGLVVFSMIVFALGCLLFHRMMRIGEQRLDLLNKMALRAE